MTENENNFHEGELMTNASSGHLSTTTWGAGYLAVGARGSSGQINSAGDRGKVQKALADSFKQSAKTQTKK